MVAVRLPLLKSHWPVMAALEAGGRKKPVETSRAVAMELRNVFIMVGDAGVTGRSRVIPKRVVNQVRGGVNRDF